MANQVYRSYKFIALDAPLTKGAPWVFNGAVLDSAGAVVNLTGATIKCSFKTDKSDTSAAFTPTQSINASAGTFSLSLTKVQTATVTARRYFYDIWIFNSAGATIMRVEGEINVDNPISSL